MSNIPSFKDMPIWQRSMRLVAQIYQLTGQLPATERLGLSSSLQQSAVSVPTVLASGTKQGRQGFQDACLQARQACAELETLLLVVGQIYPAIPVDDYLQETSQLMDALTSMARRLAKPAAPRSV